MNECLLYTGCALPDVYLSNGFVMSDQDPSRTEVADAHALHRALALCIVNEARPLDCNAFRFLREILELNRRELAETLGVHLGSIRNWENTSGKMPKAADRFVRALVLMKLSSSTCFNASVSLMGKLDNSAAWRDGLGAPSGYVCQRQDSTWSCSKCSPTAE